MSPYDIINRNTEVVLITGASSGIGKACADHLARQGYLVFGTSRRAPFPPKKPLSGSPVMIQMDVDYEESVKRGVDFILREIGHLDVLVNNAGVGLAGAVEDTPVEEAKALFETNFFGVLRACQAVLPAMREQRSGYIVNLSSIGGLIGLPYQAFYSATKFAVEGMTEGLRIEVKPYGIHVVLIEPGDISTPFVDNRSLVPDAYESCYAEDCRQVMEIAEESERSGPPPEKVAHLVARVIRHPSPRSRYRVGSFEQRLAAALKGVVPDWLFEWLLMRDFSLLR